MVLGVYVLFDSTNVNRFLYIFKSIYLNLFFKLAKTQLKSLFWPPLYKIKNLVCFPIILDISWPCLTSFGSTFTLATVMTARSTKVKLRALHLSYIILFFCCLPQGFSYIVLLHKTPTGALYVFRHAQVQHPMTQPLMNGDWKSKDKCFPSFLWANNFEAHCI